MAQLDEIVGSVMQYLRGPGAGRLARLLRSARTTALRTSRADGGQTPFAGAKGTVMEGGFRVPAIIRWPRHVPSGKVENGVISAWTGSLHWWRRRATPTSLTS